MKNQCNYNKRSKEKRTIENLNNFRNIVKEYVCYYCDNTSLHGFRYITHGTIIESGIWLTVCVLAIIFCVILMLRVWENFTNNPTVTIIDTSNPIGNLQFPGVTICNNNKVYKPHADLIAKTLLSKGFDDNMSNKLFSSLMKLIRPDTMEIDNATASWALDILGYTVDKLMYELMQPCSAMLARCAWLGQIQDCGKIFKLVKSNEGFCCGFNYHFDHSNSYGKEYSWITNISMADEDYAVHNSSEPLPGVGKILHVPGSGRDVGLAVALNVDGENYKSSVRPYIGASVLIHDPTDYPDVGAQIASVLPGHVSALSIAGTSVVSSQDIRNIPLQKRECLFDGETPNKQSYSFQTCMSECLFQQIYGFCDCLPFFYPNVHEDVRTCYLTDIDCILARRRDLSRNKGPHVGCKCPAGCNDNVYDVNSESVKVEDIGYDTEITRGLNMKNVSFLYVYFRDATYLEYRKQTIIGWDGLLAAFGGIFGLCLGGSVISIVELIYHVVVKCLDLRKTKQEEKRKSFPPASKIFVPMPAKDSLINQKNVCGEKRIFLAWDEHLYQRGHVNISRNENGFKLPGD